MKRGDVVSVFSLTKSKFPVYALDDIHDSTVAYYLKNDDQVIVLIDQIQSAINGYEDETKILSRYGAGWIRTASLFEDEDGEQ
jgi:dipeptidase